MASCVLILCTRWIRMFSFTHRPLYHPGKSVRYRLGRGLAGHQDGSGRFGEDENFLPLPGNRSTVPRLAVCSVVYTDCAKSGRLYIHTHIHKRRIYMRVPLFVFFRP